MGQKFKVRGASAKTRTRTVTPSISAFLLISAIWPPVLLALLQQQNSKPTNQQTACVSSKTMEMWPSNFLQTSNYLLPSYILIIATLYSISLESIQTLRRCSSVGIKSFILFIISDFPHRFSSKGNNFHLHLLLISHLRRCHIHSFSCTH